MKKAVRIAGVILGVLVLAVAGFFGWASYASSAMLSRTFEAHDVEIAMPFPLSEAELEALREERRAEATPEEAPAEEGPAEAGAAEGDTDDAGDADETAEPAAPSDPLEGVDLDALAMERAVARGEHLVRARYACAECHGANLGGGVMVDDPAMGTLLGPNLTTGEGSVTTEYTMADWDHTVRHGILPDGRPAVMPSEDFVRMSDRELSDIVAFIRSLPPVNATVPRSTFGPIGKILVATGALPSSASLIEDHHAPHAESPPEAAPTPEFGRHLITICTGCHRQSLDGGPIAAGPPDWIPAGNLTPHADGLAGWTFADFDRAMREGVRPDGVALRDPMSRMTPYAQGMTEVEMQALWAYLETLEPLPTGQ